MRECKRCKHYVKKHIVKVKDGIVYVMFDRDNINFKYADYTCSRCGLFLRDVPGVEVVK